MPTVPLWKELNLFLHTYSNCIFHVICRPENPQRRTSIELEDIKKSLQDNGCWPFHPSGPILLDSEDDEDNNSPIVKKTARGASKIQRFTSRVSKRKRNPLVFSNYIYAHRNALVC